MEVRPTGQIVAAGTTFSCADRDSGPRRVTVVQFDAQGRLDTSFGDGGVVVLPQTVTKQKRPELELQSSGRVVIGTSSALVGLSPEGRPDPGFGVGGTVTLDFGPDSVPNSFAAGPIAGAPDGSLVVFASWKAGEFEDFHWGLARYGSDGRLDPAFGGQGVKETVAVARDLEIDTTGLIYSGGTTDDEGPIPSVTRYTPDGEPDITYGPDGTGTALADRPGIGPGTLLVIDRMVLAPDGSTTLSGSTIAGAPSTLVRRLDPQGDPAPIDLPNRIVTATDGQGTVLSTEGPDLPFGGGAFNFDIKRQTVAGELLGGTHLAFFGNSSAHDAQFDSGGAAFGVGTIQTCSNDCGSSMVLVKLGDSPAGLDEAFGFNKGITTVPDLGCRSWSRSPVGDAHCHRQLTPYPMKARIDFGRSQKPAFTISSSLPDGRRDSGIGRERLITTKLPTSLKLRRKKPALRATLNGQRVEPRRVSYRDGLVTMNLAKTLLPWEPGPHRLVIKGQRGSFKPLRNRQRFRRYNVWQTIFYRYENGSEETGGQATKSPPVQKKRRG